MAVLLLFVSLIGMGYCARSLVVLYKVKDCLNELEPGDPQFAGKISIIRKFNKALY